MLYIWEVFLYLSYIYLIYFIRSFFNCDWSFLVWRITLKGSTYGRGVNVMFTSHFLAVTIFFVSFIPIYIYLCVSKDRSPKITLVKYSSRSHCHWLFVGTFNCDRVNHRHYMYLVRVAVLFTTDFGPQRSILTRF